MNAIMLAVIFVCVFFWPDIHRFIHGVFTLSCPDCDGEMKDHDLHFHGSSTSPVYKCDDCGKRWI